jgi:hypothetical protein
MISATHTVLSANSKNNKLNTFFIRIDKTIVDGKPVFKTININKSTTQNDAPVVYGDSIDLLMNSMTYEPMFMLAILPMAAMGTFKPISNVAKEISLYAER